MLRREPVAPPSWLQRIRGVMSMGLSWAGLWSAIGALVALLPGTMTAPYPIPGEWLVRFAAQLAIQFAAFGFVGGATFSLVLVAAEGGRRFDQMSLVRFAIWGAVGGVMMWAARGVIGESVRSVLVSIGMPGPSWAHAVSGGVIVVLGAGSAAATLALARSVDDQELLGAGEGVGKLRPGRCDASHP